MFECGAPIVMLGLDVTHKALVTEERLARIEAIGTPVAQACGGLLDFFNRYDRERYHFPGAPLHDPCVIAYLMRPDLFQGQQRRVEIETEGTHTVGPDRGRLVAAQPTPAQRPGRQRPSTTRASSRC